jgi:hypothetical protein
VATMLSARYWWLYVDANNGGVNLTVAELQFLSGGSVVTPASIVASSTINGDTSNYGPTKAFDGSTATRWVAQVTASGQAAGQWIGADFGVGVDLTSIKLMGNYSGGDHAAYAPKDFRVRRSWVGGVINGLGSTTEDVLVVTGATGWGAAEFREYTLPALSDVTSRVAARPLRWGASTLAAPTMRRRPGARGFAYDNSFGGNGKINGTVYIDGTPDVPAQKLVRLMHLRSGLVIRNTYSAADGSYEFRDLRMGDLYTVISHDHTGTYNAVVKDRIYPEAM